MTLYLYFWSFPSFVVCCRPQMPWTGLRSCGSFASGASRGFGFIPLFPFRFILIVSSACPLELLSCSFCLCFLTPECTWSCGIIWILRRRLPMMAVTAISRWHSIGLGLMISSYCSGSRSILIMTWPRTDPHCTLSLSPSLMTISMFRWWS